MNMLGKGGKGIMKVMYVNSFIRQTQDVFNLMLDLDVERGNIKVVEGLVSSRNAIVVLGVTGDLEGPLYFLALLIYTDLEMVRIMSGLEMKINR